jgi:hypothetical protein
MYMYSSLLLAHKLIYRYLLTTQPISPHHLYSYLNFNNGSETIVDYEAVYLKYRSFASSYFRIRYFSRIIQIIVTIMSSEKERTKLLNSLKNSVFLYMVCCSPTVQRHVSEVRTLYSCRCENLKTF